MPLNVSSLVSKGDLVCDLCRKKLTARPKTLELSALEPPDAESQNPPPQNPEFRNPEFRNPESPNPEPPNPEPPIVASSSFGCEFFTE